MIDKRRSAAASLMAIAGMMTGAMERTEEILDNAQRFGLFPHPRRNGGKRRQWTCRKCGGEFHPHMSATLCDECIRRRDGGR